MGPLDFQKAKLIQLLPKILLKFYHYTTNSLNNSTFRYKCLLYEESHYTSLKFQHFV